MAGRKKKTACTAEKKGKSARNAEQRETAAFANSLTAALSAMGGISGIGGVPGTSQASQADTFVKNNRWYLVSNLRQLLSQTYAEHGIVQTLVDLPVDDAFRGGIEISSPTIDEDDAAGVEYGLQRHGILTAFTQAMKWMRLFGGAGLIILDGGKPETPFDIADAKGRNITFKPCDMWELYCGSAPRNENDRLSEAPGVDYRPEFYNHYGHKIHNSRVIRFEGKRLPSLIRPQLRGWGSSVLETVVRSYNQYLKSVDLSFEVLDEFKVDYFKIDGYNSSLMSPQGTSRILERVRLANISKNYHEAVSMDTKDDIITRQLNFQGIAEIMQQIRMQIAADLRMPLTKLFGISAAGFNSGEDDIENYNAMIETEIRSKCREQLLRVIEICCIAWLGDVPDALAVEFKPLRVLSAEQEETIKNARFSRIMTALQNGIIQPIEAKEAINRDSLLPVMLPETNDTFAVQGQQNGEGQDDGGYPA